MYMGVMILQALYEKESQKMDLEEIRNGLWQLGGIVDNVILILDHIPVIYNVNGKSSHLAQIHCRSGITSVSSGETE